MSTISMIYGNKWDDYLDACIRGVQETDPIATDYPPAYRQMVAEAVSEGMANRPFTIRWIKALVEDEKQAMDLLNLIQASLPDRINNITVAEAMGNLLHKIETSPDLQANGHKIAHLVLNYLGACYGQPLMRFRKDERESYLQAIQSAAQAKVLIANKMRETVMIENQLWERFVHTPLTDRYKNWDNEKLTIQWNELVEAIQKWTAVAA